ncbi:hypothetical protein [Streptomyces sp. CT34]|uniref:hypothetical protein n=1 Tax=Streptomyces sp. CT34 TaxID=1553907 RepID=UPI0005BAABEA|nr:hypothetical protein [Streptomyces sp. CT34]
MENRLEILLSEEGAEAGHIDELAGHLREELLQLDVDDVTRLPAEEQAPPGARAGEAFEVGALLVTVGQSAEMLRQVLCLVRVWLGRCREARTSVRLKMDDDELELSKATSEQVTEAFDLFIHRHSAVGT